VRGAEVDLDTWRGWVLAGRYGAAEEALAAHVATAKNDVEALSLLADCYRKQTKWKAAVKVYRDIIEADAGAPAERARFQAASILQDELGDHAAAVPLLRAYIARRPPVRSLEAAARVRLAHSLEALGKQNAADQQLRTVVEEFPGTTAASEADALLEPEPDSDHPHQ
jgi:TolA-binding protein